jgi:site-specific DNA recombinase
MYADGVGYGRILEYLNSHGFRTKQGNLFAKNSLNSILNNEKYMGYFIWNRRQEKDIAGRRNPEERPKEEWVIVEGGVPAIIDSETFERVKARIALNSARGGRYKAKTLYLLSGFIRCGECGSSMQGNTRKDGRGHSVYSSYDCQGKHNKQGCSIRCVRKEHVENYVISELYDKVLSDVSIRELNERLNAYSQKMAERGSGDMELAQKELTSTKQKIDKLLRLVTDSNVSTGTIAEELKRLEEAKVYLERRIDELNLEKNVATFTEEMTIDLLNRSREILRTRNLVECRNVISSFIENVIVYNDRIDVVFKVQVPDNEDDGLAPLKSQESLDVIKENYKQAG